MTIGTRPLMTSLSFGDVDVVPHHDVLEPETLAPFWNRRALARAGWETPRDW